MDETNESENKPAASEFVLNERDEAQVLNSAIINQVDRVVNVLSQQIVVMHNESLYAATLTERLRCARMIYDLSTTFHQFLAM